MKENLDKISLALIIFFCLTISFIVFEWVNNAFQTHKSWVYSVDVNIDNVIASSSGNEILLWHNRYCLNKLEGHTDAIKSISFSNDRALIVSGSIDRSIRIWSLTLGKEIAKLNGHMKGVNKVYFNHSSKYVISSGYDNKLKIWDWKKGVLIKELDIQNTNIEINEFDILAYTDLNCAIRLIDITNFEEMNSFEKHCRSFKFIPKTNVIAIEIENGEFHFIDFKRNTHLNDLKTNQQKLNTFTVSTDGKFLIAAKSSGSFYFWDWRKNKFLKTIEVTNGGVEDLIVNSNNNELIAAYGDRAVRIWDLQSGQLKLVIGDGVYQMKLFGILAIVTLLTLTVGFLGIHQNTDNKYSSLAIMTLLSIWSFGILALALLAKNRFVKYSLPLLWILTAMSCLSVLSRYGVLLATFTIPVSLFLGYIKLKINRANRSVVISIVVNLILCGVLTSFIVSAGLWS